MSDNHDKEVFACLRCGKPFQRRSTLKKHYQKPKRCIERYDKRSSEDLVKVLEQRDAPDCKSCEICGKTFDRYRNFAYHYINKVCFGKEQNMPSLPHDLQHVSQGIVQNNQKQSNRIIIPVIEDIDLVTFGAESFDHISAGDILDVFHEKRRLNPDIIELLYFSQEAPQNQTLAYLGNNCVGVFRRRGWKTMEINEIVQCIIEFILLKVVKDPRVKGIADNDESVKSSLEHWEDFLEKPHNPKYVNDAKFIRKTFRKQIEWLTSPEKMKHVLTKIPNGSFIN